MNQPLLKTPPTQDVRHFFDTNFLVLPRESLPQLSPEPGASHWITETTQQEVYNKLGEQSAKEVVEGKFQILRFNDLYRENPGICPVYYWFILSMYNPANIGNEEFIEDFYHSKFIRGDKITPKSKRPTRCFAAIPQVVTSLLRKGNLRMIACVT
jgi:hypothetical protein